MSYRVFVSAPMGEIAEIAAGLDSPADAREAVALELERIAYMVDGEPSGALIDCWRSEAGQPVRFAGYAVTFEADA